MMKKKINILQDIHLLGNKSKNFELLIEVFEDTVYTRITLDYSFIQINQMYMTSTKNYPEMIFFVIIAVKKI